LIVADDPKACPKIISVRANLDSLMERADNPLAKAVLTITTLQSPLACWKTLGRKLLISFLISK
jgi:hypothetical protein